MNSIDVCLSPGFIRHFEIKDKVVVVIDILRATSTICTALAHGASKVIPVSSLDALKAYAGLGHILGAERDGKNVDGFEYGNSPFDYMDEGIKGSTIVLTTTNGTKAIDLSKDASIIIAGAFLNLSSIIGFITSIKQDVILFCAGWKDQYSLEDSLMAGAIIHNVKRDFEVISDLAHSTSLLYNSAKDNLLQTMQNGAHFKRLEKLGIQKDLEYCVQIDEIELVPKWDGEGMVVN